MYELPLRDRTYIMFAGKLKYSDNGSEGESICRQ